MNDSSWRNLSALLGVACVVLIIAAGALLATSGESATPSQLANASASANPSASGSDSGSGVTDSPGTSAKPSASVIPTLGPTGTPPAKAPIAQITFNNLMLDGTTEANGKARTFTFVTDGVGPVGIAITKNAPAKATTRICAKIDDGKADCRLGTRVTYKGATTDTAHSVWVITLIGPAGTGPTVDVAFSWPSFHASITMNHGRLQGSSSPGISEALNGFTATVKTVAAGNLGVSASWTTITPDVLVMTEDVNASSATSLDTKTYKAASNLGTPGYQFNVGAGKFYRLTLRNQSADSQRPDLTAVISIP